ncbi:MAG: 16S rRNA processing protein RimM [Chlorobia bacterium]|nr:16S rRNA processing protein RimM [Fimbriimonadaceae bacterium]
MNNLLKVGRIVSTHGLKGQVKVEVLTDFDQRLAKGERLMLKDDWVTVEISQWQGKKMLMKLSGVDSIEAAAALKWEFLSVPADSEMEMEEDQFLVEDLVGLTVVTVGGMVLGKVDRVEAYPAQDILIIGDLMIPFVEQFVKEVDEETQTIKVELIPGMLGEEEDEA